MLHYSSRNSLFNKLLLDCVFVVVVIVVVFLRHVRPVPERIMQTLTRVILFIVLYFIILLQH